MFFLKIKQIIRFNRILFIANFAVFIAIIGFFAFFAPQLFDNSGIIEGKRLVLRGDSGNANVVIQGNDQNVLMSFNDEQGNVRLQLQGGTFPALIMKNEYQEIVGTFFPLKDGGAAVGLGDREGNMATFIKGGSSPTMSFYHESNKPNIVMGISNNLPHLIIFPEKGSEGMFIQGSSPTSLLFIDEKGGIPVSLSRHGLYQQNATVEQSE